MRTRSGQPASPARLLTGTLLDLHRVGEPLVQHQRPASGRSADLGLDLRSGRAGPEPQQVGERARLREIEQAAPFIKVSELTEAHERCPAEAVTVQWLLPLEDLRQETHRFALARQTLALAEMASAEPKLRQLYPCISHWSLHFTICTGFPYSWDVPFVDPLSDG